MLSKSGFKKAKLATLRLTRMNYPAIARRSGTLFFVFPIGWLYHVIAASDFVLALASAIQWSCLGLDEFI